MNNTETIKRDEYLPYPWKKVRWATDEYIEEVTQRLYNNKSIKDVTKGTTIRIYDFNHEFVEKMVPKGVDWVRIDDPKAHMVLTQEGALYNTHRMTIQKVNISAFNITYTNESIHFNWLHLFKLAGWKYDHQTVVSNYQAKKWPYRMLERRTDNPKKINFPLSKNAIGIYPNMLK